MKRLDLIVAVRLVGRRQVECRLARERPAQRLVGDPRHGIADNGKSIAGCTAQTRMSSAEIARSHAAAKRTLAGMGIRQPSADQIQSVLIGGEVTLPNGKTRLVQGAVALRAEPVLSPVASR